VIRWLGTKKIKLDTIVLPGGFAKRKKEPHVRDLAESIKRGGVISLPVVSDKPRKLVAGGDRLAALMLLKVPAHEVRIVRGTPQELEELMLEENLLRRRTDDYAAMTRRLVELRTGDIEAADRKAAVEAVVADEVAGDFPVEATVNEEPLPTGRPKSAKGKAREEVAKELGKTPEAIRSAEKRAKAKEEAAEQEDVKPGADPGEPMQPPVETYGLPLVNAEDAYFLVVTQESLKKVDALLRKAQGALLDTAADNSIAGVLSSPIRAALHQLAADVRAAIPVAVCPYCKRREDRVSNCGACKRTGFVGSETMLGLADELRLGGEQAMVSGPRGLVPYAAKGKTPGPAKGARRLIVTDENGDEIPVDE